jgi:hypothetical protein
LTCQIKSPSLQIQAGYNTKTDQCKELIPLLEVFSTLDASLSKGTTVYEQGWRIQLLEQNIDCQPTNCLSHDLSLPLIGRDRPLSTINVVMATFTSKPYYLA